MVMFYFSGTGNSKYIAELFSQNMNAMCHSIEENVDFEKLIHAEDVIGFCYPVYMSSVPRIMREFAAQHMDALMGKKVVIFCTQLILSGDGARKFAMLFPKGHIEVIYAEHFFMPNNMNDVPLLPISGEAGIGRTIARAKRRMEAVCRDIQAGKIKKRGFSIVGRVLGFPQAVFMQATEKRANSAVSIDKDCTKCGLCIKICPMNNFVIEDDKILHKHNCTMCYRCINACPEKAITVLVPMKVKKQYRGGNYVAP